MLVVAVVYWGLTWIGFECRKHEDEEEEAEGPWTLLW